MPKNESESETLAKLDRHFSSAVSHPTWVSWRKNAETCFKYKEGDQWTEQEKAELKKRGQPPTVNNQISVTVNRMVGQFVRQKVRIGYRARNTPQDDAVANTLSDIFLFIRQNNALEFEEREMAEDGFTCGMGILESYIDFNELLEPEIKIRVESPFNIFPDPYSRRYDWNEDASYVIRAKWLHIDEAKSMWPDKAKQIDGLMTITADELGHTISSDSFTKDNYIDDKNHRIRIVEDYYKVRTQRRVVFVKTRDGQTQTLEDPDKKRLAALKKQGAEIHEISRPEEIMYAATFTAGILFEHKERKEKKFPFVPYFVTRRKDGEPYSLVWIGLSMQDAINKRESKAIHLLNNNRSFYEQGSITDRGQLANEIARPDGQVEINRGYFDKFRVDEHTDLGPINFQLAQTGKDDFRRIVGVNPDALGERSEVRSGVGIARKQAMTDIIIAPVFDNFRRTRQMLAKNVLELVQLYYTQPKVFSITDDLNSSRAVELDATKIKAMKQAIYDVVVDDLPDTTTVQEEQMGLITQTLPQILPFGPFWVQFLLQMSEIRNKEELIKQLQQMSVPPPADPKISVALQWAELIGPEKAAFAQKMGMEELAQFEAQNQAPPAHVLKAQVDLQKEQMSDQDTPGELQRDQLKTQADLAKTQMDIAAKREEHKLDIAKSEQELAQAQARHEMDMRKEAVQLLRDQVKANAARDKNSVQ